MPSALPRTKAIGCCLAAALFWGVAMTITAATGLFLRGRLETFHLQTILLIFLVGGSGGWLLTEMAGHLLRRFIRGRRLLIGLAVGGLASATIFVSAAFFALEYRSFYAQWHDEPFSRVWILQFLFTSASAYYQFAVMALPLYLPLGPLLLIVGTWIMLRRMR